MIIAAPTRFAVERATCSSSWRPVGWIPTFSVPVSSLDASCPTRRGIRSSGSSLGVREREQIRRLEPPLRLAQHHLERRPPRAARSGRAPGRACGRPSPPARASCRRARSSSEARSRARARRAAGRRAPRRRRSRRAAASGSAAACGADSWTKPASSEASVVSERPRIRSATSSARFCASASRSRPSARRVSSSSRPSRPKSSSASRPSGGEQDVAAVRVGVVDAVHRDLLDVGAEELAREHRGPLGLEAVVGDDPLAVDPLLHEHAAR